MKPIWITLSGTQSNDRQTQYKLFQGPEIHASTTTCPVQDHEGREPIPAVIRCEDVHTLEGWPVHHRAVQLHKQTTETQVYTYGQYKVTTQPNKHVFGLWEPESF